MHVRNMSLADWPTVHRDVGAIHLGPVLLSDQVYRDQFLHHAWETIASCSRMHSFMLALARDKDLEEHDVKLPGTLRKLDIRFPSSLLERAQGLKNFACSLPRLRSLRVFFPNRWQYIGSERVANLVYLIQSTAPGLSELALELNSCTNEELVAIIGAIKPLLPSLRYFTLNTGRGFAKEAIQALPQALHRLVMCCPKRAMTWHVLSALQDPLQLPSLREIPTIITCLSTIDDGDPIFTTEHVDAAIAGLKQRKYLVYSEAAAARLYELVD